MKIKAVMVPRHFGGPGAEVGEVHLRNGRISDMETLCGWALTGIQWEDTKSRLTCRGCRDTLEEIQKWLEAGGKP